MASNSTRKEYFSTCNDRLILHEVRHSLARLLETDESTIIDLRAIPMAPGEEERIENVLGEGEISVNLNALGRSTIIETTIAGVWLITHYNIEGEILGKFIEITPVPSLITSQVEDIENGLSKLTEQLSS